MDTRTGELIDDPDKIRQALEDRPCDMEMFEYGEIVQVKTGFFEVCKIDTRKQRLVLEPIPRPSGESA